MADCSSPLSRSRVNPHRIWLTSSSAADFNELKVPASARSLSRKVRQEGRHVRRQQRRSKGHTDEKVQLNTSEVPKGGIAAVTCLCRPLNEKKNCFLTFIEEPFSCRKTTGSLKSLHRSQSQDESVSLSPCGTVRSPGSVMSWVYFRVTA
ncbi:hypothetical protein INR49_000805 [Caranx melampygus]|nr:hypothetical protein INR49_000805 [Caranx melampygus]